MMGLPFGTAILFKAPELKDDLMERQRIGIVIGAVCGTRNLKVLSLERVMRPMMRVDFRVLPLTQTVMEEITKWASSKGAASGADHWFKVSASVGTRFGGGLPCV